MKRIGSAIRALNLAIVVLEEGSIIVLTVLLVIGWCLRIRVIRRGSARWSAWGLKIFPQCIAYLLGEQGGR